MTHKGIVPLHYYVRGNGSAAPALGEAVAWRGQRRPPPIESSGVIEIAESCLHARSQYMRWQHLERMRLESVAEQGVESGASFAHQSVCVRACPPLIGRCRRQFGG